MRRIVVALSGSVARIQTLELERGNQGAWIDSAVRERRKDPDDIYASIEPWTDAKKSSRQI